VSYRHDGESRRAWRLWVDQHRDSLLDCSLPEFIFSDEMRWFRFVEDGGWDQESGWRISMLSPDQASACHDFLMREYGGDEYQLLLRLLDQSRRRPHRPADADQG
jgi:hypothetical protein